VPSQKWERREREGARRRARCKNGEGRVKMQGTLGAIVKHGGEKGVKGEFWHFWANKLWKTPLDPWANNFGV
jgi:hypothetical protein